MESIELLNPSAPSTGQIARTMRNLATRRSCMISSEFQATLLAIAGHDLRQPLQVITSAHDVLATMLGSEKQRKELAYATNAAAHLARMLGQLVEALQLHQELRENLSTPVALRPILECVNAEFEEPARRRGINFRVRQSRGTALSHPVLLTSILRNLIRNAIDYTPAGGSVSVSCRRHGPELWVKVCDTGAGIPASALSTIFAAFRRGNGSRPDSLGLGLFIVKHAADLLGHRVDVRSVEGKGSSFHDCGPCLDATFACQPVGLFSGIPLPLSPR